MSLQGGRTGPGAYVILFQHRMLDHCDGIDTRRHRRTSHDLNG
jgi:hypothetical protein